MRDITLSSIKGVNNKKGAFAKEVFSLRKKEKLLGLTDEENLPELDSDEIDKIILNQTTKWKRRKINQT